MAGIQSKTDHWKYPCGSQRTRHLRASPFLIATPHPVLTDFLNLAPEIPIGTNKPVRPSETRAGIKSFLLLFFKKEGFLSFSPKMPP
jgi:hypothetical protein